MKNSLSILFWLYKSKMRNGLAPIYCRISINGKKAEIAVGKSIDPNKWNQQTGTVKGNSEDIRIINYQLQKMKTSLNEHFLLLELKDKKITVEHLKNAYLGIEEIEKSLLETFEYHNKQMKERVGLDIAKSTYTKFVTVKDKLEAFIKKNFRTKDIFLSELNHKFVVDFEQYLIVNDNIGLNTRMKYIRNLKKVINMAVSNDWLNKNPFSNFKCISKYADRITLTEEELTKLNNKLITITRIDEVRDVFLFCCYTGLAYVDILALTEQNIFTGIDGNKWIQFHRQKTNIKCTIPIFPQAQRLLDKYQENNFREITGKLFPVKSNQKMNAYLKEVADICEIDKQLTMHIARHTFATTILMLNKVDMAIIQNLLGHAKLATTQIYAKVSEFRLVSDMELLRFKLAEKSLELQLKSS